MPATIGKVLFEMCTHGTKAVSERALATMAAIDQAPSTVPQLEASHLFGEPAPEINSDPSILHEWVPSDTDLLEVCTLCCASAFAYKLNKHNLLAGT